MADQQQQLKDMRNTEAAYSKKKQHVDTFSCSVCGRVYKYSKAKDNHVKREHPNFQPPEEAYIRKGHAF